MLERKKTAYSGSVSDFLRRTCREYVSARGYGKPVLVWQSSVCAQGIAVVNPVISLTDEEEYRAVDEMLQLKTEISAVHEDSK
jgi:hypothetical protein